MSIRKIPIDKHFIYDSVGITKGQIMSKETEKSEFKSMAELMHFIQTNIKVPKSQENKFGGYKYRNLEDIKEGVKKILPAGSFITEQDEIFFIEGRFYLKSTVSLHWNKEVISTTGYAREEESKKGMDGSQVTGAASSYARKYAYNALFGIDDTKDADGLDNAGENAPQENPETVKKVDDMIKQINEASVGGWNLVEGDAINLGQSLPDNSPSKVRLRKAISAKRKSMETTNDTNTEVLAAG